MHARATRVSRHLDQTADFAARYTHARHGIRTSSLSSHFLEPRERLHACDYGTYLHGIRQSGH